MKTALIIGGDGVIGRALVTYLSANNIGCTATTRHMLDLSTSPAGWPELPRADVAYLCAAITKLETCENDPHASRKINVIHMQALAERLHKKGAFVVFLSSNQVFDGEKPYRTITDAPCPVNTYGKQKAEFEKWLLAQAAPACVLRLTKVISAPLPLLASWEAALKRNEPIEAFDDLIFAPLPLKSVLETLHDIGENKRAGILHLSGTKELSYYAIACLLAQKIGADKTLIKPVSAANKGIPSQFLPKHGTLKSSTFEGVIIPEPEAFII